MTTMLNIHKLMGRDAGYLHALSVDDKDRKSLSEARETIRDTLRDAFGNWKHFITEAELRSALVAIASKHLTVPPPKFRIQGSFAYQTVNDCQKPPQQQIDQDDGVFLPLSFVTVNGSARPTIASNAYFELVERALKPLCDQKGWVLNPSEKKGSCVRIELSARLHIDLPLYAIRDNAFEELVEFASTDALRRASIRDSQELDEQIYRDLADAEIILAHRKKGWVQSDPRRLEKWFTNAIGIYGEMVRDISRAFKGLRDAKFDEKLSSICIMASVVRAIESLDNLDSNRFDLVLIKVARQISETIGEPVPNPIFPNDKNKQLCLGWSPEYRIQVGELFRDTAEELEKAINGTYNKSIAVNRARNAFGPRVPSNEELIVLGGAAAAVQSIAAQPQPKPMVPRTRSG